MKNKTLRLSLFLFMLFFTASLYAQVDVKGIIMDEQGEGIPMAIIKVKGTTIAMPTDVFGKFRMSVPNDNATLVISYLGFKTQEIGVTLGDPMLIHLKEENLSLDEVVVIGYGSSKRKDITGVVSKVNVDELQAAPVGNFMDAMSGRVAGVALGTNEGAPGAEPTMTIRGISSITGSSSPLYVIDGFPTESSGSDLVSPSDIESIEVLKDASATAIYGARGANGVVMITTKHAKSGKIQITYDGNYGVNQITKRMNVMNTYDFVKLQYDVSPSRATTLYGPIADIDKYKSIAGTNWQDKIFRTGENQNHNLSISGGDVKTKFLISGSYNNTTGIILNSGSEKYLGRLNVDHNLSEQFKIGSSLTYSEMTVTGVSPSSSASSSSYSVYNSMAFKPILKNGQEFTDDTYDLDQNTEGLYQTNPLVAVLAESKQNFTQNLLFNNYAEYSILKNLKLRSTFAYNKTNGLLETFNDSRSKTANPAYRSYIGINGSISNAYNSNFVNENTLTYIHNFANDHSLTLMGGFSEQANKSSSNGFSSKFSPNEALLVSGLDEGINSGMTSMKSSWSSLSYLGRANYNYKSRYMLSATMRADGSSKFAQDQRWGYFPSAAFAWNLKGDLLKRVQVINMAKTRISWGVTANNRVGDFTYLQQLNSGTANSYYFNGILQNGNALTNIGNKNLTWESTAQYNLGLDLSFFDNRFSLSTDLYSKDTYNLLLNAPLPGSMGVSSATKNIGRLRNQGLELTLNSINFKGGNFVWETNFNISFNKSMIVALADGQQNMTSADYISKVGEPISQFYGLISNGLYTYDDFNKTTDGNYILKDDQPTNGQANRLLIQPGFRKFVDLNRDGLIDEKDRTVIGNPNPLHFGGFTNSFKYKWVDLSVFFQWSYGNQVYNYTRLVMMRGSIFNQNMLADYNDRWSATNPNGQYSTTLNPLSPISPEGGLPYALSTWVEDASFLRLKTISLGITLPKKTVNMLKIANIRIYCSGQNIYTFTNYKGWDPEVSTKGQTITKGWDYSAYPRALILVGGVKITL